jgi:hypothetical protein
MLPHCGLQIFPVHGEHIKARYHRELMHVLPVSHYWTSDIGGYHFHWHLPTGQQPITEKLFTRWFQFGTFSPIFRIHGKGEGLYSPITGMLTTKSIF